MRRILRGGVAGRSRKLTGRPQPAAWPILALLLALLLLGPAGCGDDDKGTEPKAPTIQLISPNGGEVLQAGNIVNITWSASDPDTPYATLRFTLELSIDAGASWILIVSDFPDNNSGRFSWPVPSISTNEGRIRVSVNDGRSTDRDTSDGNFSIAYTPPPPPTRNYLEVDDGQGERGDQVTVGLLLDNLDQINSLTTDILFDPVVVEWVSGTKTPRVGEMSFQAQEINAGRVRISMSYAGAGFLAAGEGAIANLTFELVGQEQTFSEILPDDSELLDPESEDLTVGETPGSISITGDGVNDPPVVNLTDPDGGETWQSGTVHAITWTAVDEETPVQDLEISLHYSTNGGGAWILIDADEANDGTYNWTVPNTPTTQARVRVTASDGENEGSDFSQASFTITAVPAGENTLSVGTGGGNTGAIVTVPLNLDNEDVVKALQTDIAFDPAVLEYSSGEATGRVGTMSFAASVVEGDKVRVVMYYSDAASLPAGTGAIANLSFRLLGTQGSQSALTPVGTVLSDPEGGGLAVTNQAGSISVTGGGGNEPPVVSVTSPVGGESWQAVTVHPITWTATDEETPPQDLVITLNYSTNSGGSWTQIAAGEANDGTYSWNVPNAPTTQARVRVTASDGVNSISATSPANFTIQAAPGGDNILAVGTAGGDSGTEVTVSLSLDNDDGVKALQTDIAFDPDVVEYVSGAKTARVGTMSYSASVVGGGHTLRVVMYYSDANSLAAGTGAIADLTFRLVGAGGTQSALTPGSSVLSDPGGTELDVTNQAGSISVTGGGGGGGNILSVGTESGASGQQVTVPLILENEEAVKALQTDIAFDPEVLQYQTGAATVRVGTMSYSASVVGGGNTLRVVMYYSDASTLAAGSGAVANLVFTLIGAGGTQSNLTPGATVLSDAAGSQLEVTDQAGSITVQ